ncbi:HAD family hydrolase [bacterium]|nr:HAD family hydrolase [bacterium]
MSRDARAVLFDFGGTLFDYADLARAQVDTLQALARRLGLDADPGTLATAHRRAAARVFREYLPKPYYLHEHLFGDTVRETGRELGRELSEDDVAFWFAEQFRNRARDFRLCEGVVETLEALRARGLHLGIVSNIDDADLYHLVDLGGLRPHFDSLLSSEAAGSCKPDPRIFDVALERAGCAPGEALFVGDTISQDVAGANRRGMRSVLLWHRDDKSPPEGEERPHHVVRRIPDLLDLIDR